jgi:SAM-dependent methyltransferase
MQHLTYEALAPSYDTPANRRFYRRLAHLLVPTHAIPSGARALDLACGTGISTEVLTSTRPDLAWEGLDASSAMLNIAQSKPTLAPATLTLGRAECLPYEEGRFSWIACNFAYHWFGTAAEVELARVLATGGVVTMTVPLRAAHASRASGNRLLARALLARRKGVHRSRSRGLDLSALNAMFDGWRDVAIEHASFIEPYASIATLLTTLESRGSLSAIFGDTDPPRVGDFPPSPSPLAFEWRVGIVHARR